MAQVLHRSIVLVLNRNWQAIDITSPALAFGQMCTDVATALDIRGRDAMEPVPWEAWLRLPIRPGDQSVGTPGGRVRVPTVIVLSRFDRVPLKRPRFGVRGIWERDEGRCQYTGRKLAPGEGNIDHVVPRSRGGRSTWENCVLADKRINTRKGNRTPPEAGLSLIRPPGEPRAVPVTVLLRNHEGIPDWEPFLIPVPS
jgi:5-methylcytosine-specific restriction endonuclease McrA